MKCPACNGTGRVSPIVRGNRGKWPDGTPKIHDGTECTHYKGMCGKKPPPHWIGASVCVKRAGHGPKYDGAVMLKGSGHVTEDGRKWPAGNGGKINGQFA